MHIDNHPLLHVSNKILCVEQPRDIAPAVAEIPAPVRTIEKEEDVFDKILSLRKCR